MGTFWEEIMQTQEAVLVEVSRTHTWTPKPGPTHPYWEERVCTVCLLDDMRLRNRNEGGSRKDWSVTTPCIEPVPERVSYRELMQELRAHQVTNRPLVIGVPGKWQVGFCIGGGGYHVYPSIEAKTVKRGFSLLLTWIRARQYDVRKYSDIDYQDSLNTPDYHDDD